MTELNNKIRRSISNEISYKEKQGYKIDEKKFLEIDSYQSFNIINITFDSLEQIRNSNLIIQIEWKQ